MRTFVLSIAMVAIASIAFAQEPAKAIDSIKVDASVVQEEAKVEPTPQEGGGSVAPAVAGDCCNPDPCCRRRPRIIQRMWSRLGSRRCCCR